MKPKSIILVLFFALIICSFPIKNSFGGNGGIELDVLVTDTASEEAIVGFFDLRDRETFMQVTNVDTDPAGQVFHIQIFNVANDCNENNFFDAYTINDTHVYNLRDIVTNDGNPSGVVLPDDAYGIFVAHTVDTVNAALIGNMRILDNNGYEYRTNLVGTEESPDANESFATFNFNTLGGVTLSDIVGFVHDGDIGDDQLSLANILDIWALVDIDILNLDEVVFSCRNVIFSCVDQDNPLLEALLEEVGNASVASIEYGINNAIPHSKGGELLCPGNTISEGFVRLNFIDDEDDSDPEITIFIGLNNGNGRGSMDVMWNTSATDALPSE